MISTFEKDGNMQRNLYRLIVLAMLSIVWGSIFAIPATAQIFGDGGFYNNGTAQKIEAGGRAAVAFCTAIGKCESDQERQTRIIIGAQDREGERRKDVEIHGQNTNASVDNNRTAAQVITTTNYNITQICLAKIEHGMDCDPTTGQTINHQPAIPVDTPRGLYFRGINRKVYFRLPGQAACHFDRSNPTACPADQAGSSNQMLLNDMFAPAGFPFIQVWDSPRKVQNGYTDYILVTGTDLGACAQPFKVPLGTLNPPDKPGETWWGAVVDDDMIANRCNYVRPSSKRGSGTVPHS